MPRQVRIEYPGASYHVMCRGDRGEPIFDGDSDRERFLATLEEASGRVGWLVHAYVLMGNHYHLLLETPEPNLVAGMTWFQTTYTVRYNTRHRVTGHLFGGRYKAVLVQAEEGGSAADGGYFSTLLDYIHLNPVRAGIVSVRGDKRPDVVGYRWSSLPSYGVKPSLRPEFLATSRGLRSFGLKDGPAGRRQFIERVELRAQREMAEEFGLSEIEGQSLQSTLRRGWCYGSATFKEKMLGLAEELLARQSGKRGMSRHFRDPATNDHNEKRANEIIAAGVAAFGLDEAALPELKKNAIEKVLIAALVRRETAVRIAWLAERLSMGSPADVSRASRAVAEHLSADPELRRVKKEIDAIISS